MTEKSKFLDMHRAILYRKECRLRSAGGASQEAELDLVVFRRLQLEMLDKECETCAAFEHYTKDGSTPSCAFSPENSGVRHHRFACKNAETNIVPLCWRVHGSFGQIYHANGLPFRAPSKVPTKVPTARTERIAEDQRKAIAQKDSK